jgi:OOP family OmpA-OmpF porin
MTRTQKLLAAIAVSSACSPALAQNTGFYAGAALGQASHREACADFDRLAGAGTFSCLNREDTAGKIFAGWRFLPYLAAELSVIDFGEAKASGTVGGGAAVRATSSVTAAGISALGILPLGERFSAFGRLGLLQTRTRTQAQGAVTASDKHGETEMHVGIGALYQFTGAWGMRVEYERLNDTKIDLFSLGVQYRF